MPNRILREGINSSLRIDELSTGAELLYRRLMSVVDDYGRFYASPGTIRGACWPLNPTRISEEDVSRWLAECCLGPKPLIRLYESRGAQYLEITDFGQKVRSKSKFPEPDGSVPSIETYVYFIQGEESKRVKIGFTEGTPEKRLAILQTGSSERLVLLGYFPGGLAEERNLHDELNSYRLAGEWFAFCPQIADMLQARCQQNASTSRSRSRSRISESESNRAPDPPPVSNPPPDPKPEPEPKREPDPPAPTRDRNVRGWKRPTVNLLRVTKCRCGQLHEGAERMRCQCGHVHDPERAVEVDPIAETRELLFRYVQQCGLDWSEPDEEICARTLEAAGGIVALVRALRHQLLIRKKKPEQSYGWFPIAVASRRSA